MLLFTYPLAISTIMTDPYVNIGVLGGLFWCRVIKLIIYAHSLPNNSIEETLLPQAKPPLLLATATTESTYIAIQT
jgi:hypothetical protein